MSAEAIGEMGGSSFVEEELEESGSLDGRGVQVCGKECFNIASFTAAAARELLSSNLFYAAHYKPRRIEDRGSICASLTGDGIDIFRREAVEESWVLAPLRALARGVAALVVGLFCAVAGVCYHLRFLESHLFKWFKSSGEEAAYHWQKTARHTASMFQDLVVLGLTLLGIFSLVKGRLEGEVAPQIGGALLLAPLILSSLFAPAYLLDGVSPGVAAAYKSHLLKMEYGVVNQQGGFLSWDLEKDREFRSFHFSEIQGCFGAIFKEEGRRFLEAVRELQRDLPEGHKLPYTYPPTARRISLFLDRHEAQIRMSKERMKDWKERFQYHENNFKEMAAILQKCFSLQFSPRGAIYHLAIPPFPLDGLCCRQYFD